jgi:pimeloyl-ACP methyl ester carboxylesterase
MRRKQSHAADLIGVTRLAADAVLGVTELVEAAHLSLLENTLGPTATRPLARVAALAYGGVKGATRIVGASVDTLLGRLADRLGGQDGWAGREATLAVLNGVLGDRLAASDNPLAIPMTLAPAGAMPAAPSRRLLVLVHGLCMNDLEWLRAGVDHGAMLERERGYTALRLHYNSGLHISVNGRELARRLDELLEQWPVPVEELVILGHSMGGLVARSACAIGLEEGRRWMSVLSKMVFLGTPHHGAPLERGGQWLTAVTGRSALGAPLSHLARLRSAGITDLRHGSVVDADWLGKDRFAHVGVLPQVVPLPSSVRGFAIAASIARERGEALGRLPGDGLVPVASAMGWHPDRPRRLRIARADQAIIYRAHHMDLLSSPQVQQRLLDWL